jgi:ParB family chromosome partitioning protein
MATKERTSESMPYITDYTQIEVIDGFNHRTSFSDIDRLAASIQEIGMIDPIKVTRNPKGSDFDLRLIDGERRLKAVQMLHEQDIEISFPVRILQGMDDESSVIVAATSNMERSDITPLEEGNIVAKMEAYGYDTKEIASKLSRSDQWVRDRKALEGGSRKIKNALGNNRIPADVAVKLIRKHKDHKEQDKALTEVVTAAGGQKSNTRKAAAKKGHGGSLKPSAKELEAMSDDLKTLEISDAIRDAANASLAYADGSLPPVKYKKYLETIQLEAYTEAAG